MLSGVGGGNSVTWNKPPALVCHICGREYGTTSLRIHVPQCERMWIEREKLKPPRERRPVPQAAQPIGAALNPRDKNAMAAYNEAATQAFNERALVACPNCGRTFFEDRLAVHQRSCKPGKEAARVGTGRIKSATEAVAAATPIKRPPPSRNGLSPISPGSGGGVAGGGGNGTSSSQYGASLSPQTAAMTAMARQQRSPPASASPSRPRTSAGIMSTTSGGSNGRSRASSSRPSPSVTAPAAASRSSSGRAPWEEDLDAELSGEMDADNDVDTVPSTSIKVDYAHVDDGGVDDDFDSADLVPCSLCGRRFHPDRISKHEMACKKQQASDAKRAAKIAAKQAARPPRPSTAPGVGGPGGQSNSKNDAWKSKHQEFQDAIKYAKQMAAAQKAGISVASLPPPPRSENPDYVPCPHCGRRFNQQAAERHIPACKNTINKPKPLSAIRGHGASPSKPPPMGSMAAQRQRMNASGGAVAAMRPNTSHGASGGFGSNGATTSSYHGDAYSSSGSSHSSSRPTTSGSGGSIRNNVGRSSFRTPPIAGSGGGSGSGSGSAARRTPSAGPGPRGRSSAAGSGDMRSPPSASSRSSSRPRNSYTSPSSSSSSSSSQHRGSDDSDDLHAKINQLTETVQMLSKAVLSPPRSAAGQPVAVAGRRASASSGTNGGGSGSVGICRSCGEKNPLAAQGAVFCPFCGARS